MSPGEPPELSGSLHRRPKGPSPDLFEEWNEEVVPRPCHSSRDHHGVRIEGIEEVRDSYPRNLAVSRITSSANSSPSTTPSYTVAAVISSSGPPPVHENGLYSGFDPLPGAGGDVRSGGVGLQTTVVPTFTLPAGEIDGRMAEFPRCIGSAVIDLAVDDESAADPGSEGQAHQYPGASSRPHPPLPVCGAVGVIIQGGWEPHPSAHQVPEGQVSPSEIRSLQNDPGLPIQGPRRADPDPGYLVPGPALGPKDLVYGLPAAATRDDIVGPRCRERRLPPEA